MYCRALVACCLLAAGTCLRAADWPSDYVVQKETVSPDRKYSLAVRSRASILENASDEANKVYLVNIAEHRVLEELRDVDYFEGQNHRDLRAYWATDSRWCVVQ